MIRNGSTIQEWKRDTGTAQRETGTAGRDGDVRCQGRRLEAGDGSMKRDVRAVEADMKGGQQRVPAMS